MKTGITFIFLITLLSLMGCSGNSDENSPNVQEKLSVPAQIGTILMDVRL